MSDQSKAGANAAIWLVWSNEHMSWWASERRSYTRQLTKAGRYSYAEAIGIAGGQYPSDMFGLPDEIVVLSPEGRAMLGTMPLPWGVWRAMEDAPRNGRRILLLTGDFGVVEGWWDAKVPNFYKSDPGCLSYDPADMMGDWVSDWQISAGAPGNDPKDHRLSCGCIPQRWMPLPGIDYFPERSFSRADLLAFGKFCKDRGGWWNTSVDEMLSLFDAERPDASKVATEEATAIKDAGKSPPRAHLDDVELCVGCQNPVPEGAPAYRYRDGPVACEACAPTLAEAIVEHRESMEASEDAEDQAEDRRAIEALQARIEGGEDPATKVLG